MSRIRIALESLLDFPDPSPVPLTDPSPDREMRESAARLIGLAADFVHAVDEEGHIRELHNRVLQFDDITGTQSRLNKLREATYERIMEAFRQAPPGIDRLRAAELGGPVEDFPGEFIKAAGIITQDIDLRTSERVGSEQAVCAKVLLERLCHPAGCQKVPARS